MLRQWKNEVVDRVRDIANDQFDFDEDSDVINIEDPWAEHNWGKHDEGDASFQNYDYTVTRYKFEKPEKIIVSDYVNPDMPDYLYVQNIETLPETFSLEGPVYTLETLPEVALEKINTSSINTDNPDDLRFIIIFSNGSDGITIYTVNELAPGIYKRDVLDSPIRTHAEPYHTQEINGEIVEISPEWKDVNVTSLAKCKLTKVDVQSTTININDYNTPEQLTPTTEAPPAAGEPNTPTKTPAPAPEPQNPVPQQPEPMIVLEQEQPQEKISFSEPATQPPEQLQPEIKGPTLMELTEMESQQQLGKMLGQHNQPPAEYLSVNGYQPQETKRNRVEPNVPVRKPLTDSQLINFGSNVSFDEFQETVSDSGQLPERIKIQPNYIDLNNEEFDGDVIIHQFDQESQKVMVSMAEDAATTTSDLTLLYVGVQFPVAGTVISGIQGAATGYENAVKNGKNGYETVWNMTVGAVTNAGTGIVSNKIGDLGKLKITGKTGKKMIDYAGGYMSNIIGGSATEEMTNYDSTYGNDSGGLYINPGLNLVK